MKNRVLLNLISAPNTAFLRKIFSLVLLSPFLFLASCKGAAGAVVIRSLAKTEWGLDLLLAMVPSVLLGAVVLGMIYISVIMSENASLKKEFGGDELWKACAFIGGGVAIADFIAALIGLDFLSWGVMILLGVVLRKAGMSTARAISTVVASVITYFIFLSIIIAIFE